MIGRFKTLMERPLYRYLFTGVTIYLFELIVIFVAMRMDANAVFAVAVSFWLGLIASFIMQKVFTFGDKRTQHRILIPQLAAFSLLVLFNFGFTVLVTGLLDAYVPAYITRTVALGITTIWNFYLYKTRIFKQGPSKEITY